MDSLLPEIFGIRRQGGHRCSDESHPLLRHIGPGYVNLIARLRQADMAARPTRESSAVQACTTHYAAVGPHTGDLQLFVRSRPPAPSPETNAATPELKRCRLAAAGPSTVLRLDPPVPAKPR